MDFSFHLYTERCKGFDNHLFLKFYKFVNLVQNSFLSLVYILLRGFQFFGTLTFCKILKIYHFDKSAVRCFQLFKGSQNFFNKYFFNYCFCCRVTIGNELMKVFKSTILAANQNGKLYFMFKKRAIVFLLSPSSSLVLLVHLLRYFI